MKISRLPRSQRKMNPSLSAIESREGRRDLVEKRSNRNLVKGESICREIRIGGKNERPRIPPSIRRL